MGTMAYPDYPRQIKIEPVYGCNRSCAFCSLHNEENEIHYMEEALFFDKIAPSFIDGVVKQVGFSIHGEPTLHPSYLEFIKETRRRLPNAVIITFTNGYQIERRKDLSFIREMFEAGVSHVHLDLYAKSTEALYEEADKSALLQINVVISDCYEESVLSSKAKRLLSVAHPSQANLSDPVTIRHFDTQGGSTKYENWDRYGVDKSALPVFRTCKELNKYITLTYEGKAKICCADGSRSLYVGDIKEETLEQIWKGEKADMIRYALHRGRRDIVPACYSCARLSFRDALWPHWGKTYPLEEIRFMIADNFLYPKPFMSNMAKLNEDKLIKEEPLASFLTYYKWGK